MGPSGAQEALPSEFEVTPALHSWLRTANTPKAMMLFKASCESQPEAHQDCVEAVFANDQLIQPENSALECSQAHSKAITQTHEQRRAYKSITYHRRNR